MDWYGLTPATISTVYVDPISGLDTNPGTEMLPFKTLRKSIHGVSVATTVFCKPGLYDRTTAFADANPLMTALVLKVWGVGKVTSSMNYPGLVWSKTVGLATTYEATIITVGAVADAGILTVAGDYSRYTLVASAAAVDALPGSYYVTGTTVYVNRLDGSPPSGDQVRVYINTRNFLYNVADGVLWAQGFEFEGGNRPCQIAATLDVTKKSTAYLIDCSMKYSENVRSGLNTDAGTRTFLLRCTIAMNGADGANYHYAVGSAPPYALEEACTSRYNGWTATGTNNDSTMHDGGTIYRVGGTYFGGQDRVVHDINASWSFNVYCSAGGSRSVSPLTRVSWAAGTGATDASQMYLQNCSGNSDFNFRTEGTGAVIYYKDFTGALTTVAGSTITPY